MTVPAHRLAAAHPHPRATFTVVNTCVGCGACIATCPERAFRAARPAAVGEPPLVVLAARCTACGECAEVCPVDACVEVEHDDASD